MMSGAGILPAEKVWQAGSLPHGDGYFLAPPFAAPAAGLAAPGAGLAPAAGAAPPAAGAAPSAPSSALAAFFFFLSASLRTRTFARPRTLSPSCHRSVSLSLAILSARVSTLRLEIAPAFTRRLLSIVIFQSPSDSL